MRPVVLSVVEGKNFLLGTFDTTNFADWWKSEPFPGDIDSIQSPIHVYGQYHICIVKMIDGSYSIYRTKNMGKSWESVYNTINVIYTLTTIDYGWIVGSTSAGWIESKLDSGYTWSSISSFAPGCKAVINIDDDILFAHDGNAIWRSYDFAKTWKKILDKSGWTSVGYHNDNSTKSFQWDSLAYPALAGTGQTIFVGFGPYLVISEDLGKTWFTHLQGWDRSWGHWGSPSGTILFSPWKSSQILQIVVTDVNGITLDDSVVMARVLNTSDNTVRYAYSGDEYHYQEKGTGFSWKTIFSLPFATYDNGKISSYDVLRPGSSSKDRLTVVCSYNSENNAIVKYSLDGGWTWSTLNYSDVTVYEGDPDQEIVSDLGQQVFDEEYWTKSTWVGAACHNSGKFKIDYNKTVRGISFDADFLIQFRKKVTDSKPNLFDITIAKILYKTFTNDVMIKKTLTTQFDTDYICKKFNITKPFVVGGYIKTMLTETYTTDIAIAVRIPLTYDMYPSNQKTCLKELITDLHLMGNVDKTYEMGLKLIDDHVEQVMNSIERYTVQFPDIRYPNLPYKPYDSHNQEVVL